MKQLFAVVFFELMVVVFCQQNISACHKDEIFNDCASPCLPEPSCVNPNPISTRPCSFICIKRCECDRKSGFIRDRLFGKCVKKSECKDYCTSTEIFNSCASCDPEPSCQNTNPSVSRCPTMCFQRCECNTKEGYIRDEATGECVKTCPKKCPCNQIIACTNPCNPEPTCQHRKLPISSTIISCGGLCFRKCVCDYTNGFIRNEVDDSCIKIEDCPDITCGENEYKGCAPCPCTDPTCKNPTPQCKKDLVCPRVCIPECRCNEGYIRDFNGKCIPKDKCLKILNN